MKIRCIPVALFFSLVLSACTLQMNTTIRPDGSNDLRMEMGFTAADKEMLKSYGSPTDDLCAEMESGSDLPPGTSFTREERGDETWCIVTMTYGSLEELQTMLEEGEGITVNRLEISDGKLYYDLAVDMSSAESSMGETFPMTMKWQVTVPGRVGENNADKVEGKTLTWDLPVGESANIQVESSLSGGGLPNWLAVLVPVLICLCCFGFVVVAAVVAFVLVRRRKGATPVEDNSEPAIGKVNPQPSPSATPIEPA